jgi:hypothetical protein
MVDVVRISGHRRDWRKVKKKGTWKIKKKGTKEMGIKDKAKNKRRGNKKCQEESRKW